MLGFTYEVEVEVAAVVTARDTSVLESIELPDESYVYTSNTNGRVELGFVALYSDIVNSSVY